MLAVAWLYSPLNRLHLRLHQVCCTRCNLHRVRRCWAARRARQLPLANTMVLTTCLIRIEYPKPGVISQLLFARLTFQHRGAR